MTAAPGKVKKILFRITAITADINLFSVGVIEGNLSC